MPSLILEDRVTLILWLRRSRSKARALALEEVGAILEEFDCQPARGGPLSEVPGTAWVTVRRTRPSLVRAAIGSLGYTRRVGFVHFLQDDEEPAADTLRWKRRPIRLIPVYEESDSILSSRAPHKRSFRLECGDGIVRRIQGYRGGCGLMERRALPPSDARLLVNLLGPVRGGVLLDPYAGAGAILIEAVMAGWKGISMDIDASLRFGLHDLASSHIVASAGQIPLAALSVDGIATEPPYDESADSVIRASVTEMYRVLRDGARCSVMVAARQGESLLNTAKAAGFHVVASHPVDRKGTDVAVQLWHK